MLKKKINGIQQFKIKHWKTETINELYIAFKIQDLPLSYSQTYFAKFIPWYVRSRINYSGLCCKHDVGIFFTQLFTETRKKWYIKKHFCNNQTKYDCDQQYKCKCAYCS